MSITIFPLSEGDFTIGHDKIFHPFDEKNDILNERPIGSLLVEIQPFLLKIDNEYILLDTGLGFKMPDGTLQIHHNLEKIGISPLQINKVILSHLHKDHAGGICYHNNLNINTLSFPNASYYVSKKEFEYAMEKGAPSYVIEDFDILKNNQQVEWLSEKGNINNVISYEEDGGHCPHHTSFLIQKEDEKIFFGGDVAPQLKQLKIKYIAKYDFDGKHSMLKRQEYAEKGKAAHWQFLFYHDVKEPKAFL